MTVYLLTEDALLVCDHVLGTVVVEATQDLVTIEGRCVLVERDPERRPIRSCPNVSVTIKPCQHTLAVQEGDSDLIRVEDRRACIDTVTGMTDGTPPGVVHYTVRSPGQTLVAETG